MSYDKFFDGNGSEPVIQTLLAEWMEAMQAGDTDNAKRIFSGITGAIGQMLHPLTREVGTEVKAALFAVGHALWATKICQVYITVMPDVEVNEHGHPVQNDDGSINSHIMVGCRLHEAVDKADQEPFRDAFNKAVVSAMRANGLNASWDVDGALVIDGRADTLDQHIENEASKFAEDIEKELGESAPDPDTGERKWW